jgi:hypothetical protein
MEINRTVWRPFGKVEASTRTEKGVAFVTGERPIVDAAAANPSNARARTHWVSKIAC